MATIEQVSEVLDVVSKLKALGMSLKVHNGTMYVVDNKSFATWLWATKLEQVRQFASDVKARRAA